MGAPSPKKKARVGLFSTFRRRALLAWRSNARKGTYWRICRLGRPHVSFLYIYITYYTTRLSESNLFLDNDDYEEEDDDQEVTEGPNYTVPGENNHNGKGVSHH